MIDYLLLPASLLPAVSACSSLVSLGHKIRCSHHPRFLDHVPVYMSLDCSLRAYCFSPWRLDLDREKLMSCMLRGTGRDELVDDAEQFVEQVERQWSLMEEDRTPDARWELLVGGLQQLAAKHFGKGGRAAVAENAERARLLHER
eukprot:10138516-Alexandrium_andersonii.AAC.1